MLVVQLLQVKILGKCEFANPSGSIKDRIADHILTTAENEGKLKPGGTVVAATSGNTGASVAMISAMKGYKYIGVPCMPLVLTWQDLLLHCCVLCGTTSSWTCISIRSHLPVLAACQQCPRCHFSRKHFSSNAFCCSDNK